MNGIGIGKGWFLTKSFYVNSMDKYKKCEQSGGQCGKNTSKKAKKINYLKIKV